MKLFNIYGIYTQGRAGKFVATRLDNGPPIKKEKVAPSARNLGLARGLCGSPPFGATRRNAKGSKTSTKPPAIERFIAHIFVIAGIVIKLDN